MSVRIRDLIPHQGAMCLLDDVLHWTERAITCRAVSHLDPANPLRHEGRLGILCGCEYGMQAAALHGALCEDPPRRRTQVGYIARLRVVHVGADRLDDASLGALTVQAEMQTRGASGLIYRFHLHAASGTLLLEGQGTVLHGAAESEL